MRRQRAAPGLLSYEYDADDLSQLRARATDRRLLLAFGAVLEQLVAGEADRARAIWARDGLSALVAQLRKRC